MAEIEVRDATIEDAPAIAHVSVRSWQTAYRGMIDQHHLDSLDEAQRSSNWRRTIEDGESQVIVALLGDQPAGFAAFFATRDDDARSDCGEVGAIYAVPEVWNQGVGRALMGEALARLTDAGFNAVTLWVLDGNERAIRFYERCGFRADGTTKTDESRGYPLHELRYRRALDPNGASAQTCSCG